MKQLELQTINPEILTLLREARGFTQGELAKTSGVAQPTLSRYENDLIQASAEHVFLLANALKVSERLLTKVDNFHPVGSVCLFHRKRESTSVRDARRLRACVNWRLMQLKTLLRDVEVLPAQDTEFPRFDISEEYGSPEDIADLVRRSLRIPNGPIKNLVGMIERAGGVVIEFDFGTSKVDAMSAWESSLPPVFFINSSMTWDRIRMSLAHEIGHMVMHRHANPDQEDQAQSFASAFLMPAEDVRRDIRDIDLPSASALKHYWRVSMQALIYRANQLHEIAPSKYKALFTQLSKAGYRKREPNPISREEVQTLKQLINIHMNQNGYSITDMASILDISTTEFVRLYLMANFQEVA